MSLVVEDNTGKSNADSYISLTNADTYFDNHGAPAAWTALDDDAKDSALRYAAKWLDARYSWPGIQLTTTPTRQSLQWPRTGSYYTDTGTTISGVPQEIKDAQCELALAHASAALNAVLARGGEIKAASLGPMSVEFTESAPVMASYPYIDALLANVACSVGTSMVSRILSFGVSY